MAGYDETFLGADTLVPLPEFAPSLAGDVFRSDTLAAGHRADYVNYTVVMNRPRRSPILAALNIDRERIRSVPRSDDWDIDSRIGAEFQLDDDYYRDNPWDKGHLARRASAAWGDSVREARRASDETFYYTNASLQHANFNRDEWLAMEDWVLSLDEAAGGKVSSFSGPVWGDFGRSISPPGRQPAIIPSAFWKVVCFRNAADELDVRAFLMMQDEEALADRRGRRLFDFQNYQVTVSELEDLTGLQFAEPIYTANPLRFHVDEAAAEALNISHFPERIEVDAGHEIVAADDRRDFFADDMVPVYLAAAMVNPAGREQDGEWVSILNLGAVPVDLTGWMLSDTLRRPLVLGAGVLGGDAVLQPGQAAAVRPVAPLRLANSGGTLALFQPPGEGEERGPRVDRVSWTEGEGREQGRPVVFAYRRGVDP